MNPVHTPPLPARSAPAGRRGLAASVIVLALVAVMAALLLSTIGTVAALDRELRLIEQRQLRKYDLPSPAPARPQTPPQPIQGNGLK